MSNIRSRDSFGPDSRTLEEDISFKEIRKHDFGVDNGSFPECWNLVFDFVGYEL